MSEVLSENNLPKTKLRFYLNFARDNVTNFDIVLETLSKWVEIFNTKNVILFEMSPYLDDPKFLHSFFKNFPKIGKKTKNMSQQ